MDESDIQRACSRQWEVKCKCMNALVFDHMKYTHVCIRPCMHVQVNVPVCAHNI